MSKLDELIAKLCPNGVEYRTFGESATIVRGASPRPIKNFITTEPTGVNWIKIGDVKPGDKYITASVEKITPEGAKKSRAVKKGDFILSNSMSFGRPYILQINGCIHDGWLAISDFSDSYLSDFLYHLLNSNSCQNEMRKKASFGGAVQNLNADIVRALVLPVPPLEVQREIVRILDNFTSLKAELQAELQARKKQYEYYRDTLLIPPHNDAEQVTLSDVVNIKNGKDYKHLSEGIYPVYGSGGVMTYVSEYAYNKPSVLIPRKGSLNNLFYVEKPFWNVDTVFYTEINEKKIIPKYLFYLLQKEHLESLNKAGGVPSLTQSVLNKVKLNIPPLDMQKKIVDCLDNFEKICSDLNIGLPAEIEARQKQYEYYRDALLSFDNSYFVNVERERERERDEWRSGLIKLWQYVFGYAPVKLKDIATISRGGNFQKKDFVKIGKPCIHYGQMYTHFGIYADKTLTFVNNDVFAKSKTAKPGDIVMAVTSENVEDVCSCTAWLGNEEIAVSGHTAIISHNQNAKYMSYFFHSATFFEQKKRLAHGTKVIEVTPSKLGDIKIMLPTIQEQERIVSILDRFDSLCNDISSGLPAEIEARQKQYEYYRDKLLSF